MNLGMENKNGGIPVAAKPEALMYPSFSVADEKAEHLCEEHDLDTGDEGTALIKWKVSGKSDDQFGKRITFDVMEMSKLAKGRKDTEERPGFDSLYHDNN